MRNYFSWDMRQERLFFVHWDIFFDKNDENIDFFRSSQIDWPLFWKAQPVIVLQLTYFGPNLNYTHYGF